MSQNDWEKKNTVKGDNQVSSGYVTFEGKKDGSPRIMFIGNSITRHAPKEDIGWYGDWGMAASSKEKDYVHRVIAKVQEKNPDAAFCIVQAAIWERTYKACEYEKNFSEAKDFNPDIIICSISGNIRKDEFEHDAFIENIEKLHNYLRGTNKEVKIIESSSFSGDIEKVNAIREYTGKVGAKYVDISDVRKNEENLAIGLFWHDGVQIHPGDKGMQILADRYIEAMKEYIEI